VPAPVDPGRVSLHALHIIHLREGRDGEPSQLAAADTATVLHLLRADLAWLERAGRDHGGGARYWGTTRVERALDDIRCAPLPRLDRCAPAIDRATGTAAAIHAHVPPAARRDDAW
jgi:hypothetical protein